MADTQKPITRGRAVLLLIAIFAAGVICGGALVSLFRVPLLGHPWKQPPGGVDPIDRLERDLQLEPDQVDELGRIMKQQGDSLRSVLEETRLKIRETLTPEQREKFDNLRPPKSGRPGPPGRRGGPPPGGVPGDHPPPPGGILGDHRPPPMGPGEAPPPSGHLPPPPPGEDRQPPSLPPAENPD